MGEFFSIDIQYNTSILTKRGHTVLMKDLHRHLARRHKRETMKKHFSGGPETAPGGGGYRYQRRSKKYNEKKQKRFGHKTPLVYTGGLKKSVLTKSVVRATKSKWTFKAKAPFPLNQARRDEREVISPRELREYKKWLKVNYARFANQPKYKRFRRQRIR